MLTQERVIARPFRPPRLEEERPAPVGRAPRPEVSVPHLLGRLLVVGAGFGLAFTGWMLVMSVIFVFIGFPLFFVGLAVIEAALRAGER